MSGGHFEYNQYKINDIAEEIEKILNRQGKEKPSEDLWCRSDYYEKYPEERYYYTYPKEVQDAMKEAIKQLKIAAIYAHRVDRLLSGDDGGDYFIERLNEDLSALNDKL